MAKLPTRQAVQVLDISLIGVLLQSSRRIDPGTRACLRLNLAGAPFSADVEVRRVAPVGDGLRESGYRIGAKFVGIALEHRQLIERFASQ